MGSQFDLFLSYIFPRKRFFGFNFALVIAVFGRKKFLIVTDGGGWWWVPKRFSDFPQILFIVSLNKIKMSYFRNFAKKLFLSDKNPTSSFKIGGIL